MPHKSIQGSSLNHGNGPPRGIPRGRGNAQVIEPLAGRLGGLPFWGAIVVVSNPWRGGRHRCLKNGEKVLGRCCQNPGKYISGVNNLFWFFMKGTCFSSLAKVFLDGASSYSKICLIGGLWSCFIFLFIFCSRVSLGEVEVQLGGWGIPFKDAVKMTISGVSRKRWGSITTSGFLSSDSEHPTKDFPIGSMGLVYLATFDGF